MLQKFKLFIIIGILLLVFLPGFSKLQELKQRLDGIEDQIKKAQKENWALEERITQLESNRDYLEMVAREKMGVVKKGETVLRLIREDEIPAGNAAANATKSPSQ